MEQSRSRTVAAKTETEASERSSELEQLQDQLEEQKMKVVELEMSQVGFSSGPESSQGTSSGAVRSLILPLIGYGLLAP